MTEEEYKSLLTKSDIPIEYWFEFFLEKGGAKIDINLFTEIFVALIKEEEIPITGSDGSVKWVSLQSATAKFHDHYRKQFNL